MKKAFFGMVALSLALASCGGGAKTDAQILEEAKKAFEGKKAEFDKQAVEACDKLKATEVDRLADSIKQANAPAPTEEKKGK